jgi:hypothetical protein
MVGASELKIGDRVLIRNGSRKNRDWAFKPVPIIVKITGIDEKSFNAVYDEKDNSKVTYRNCRERDFWYNFDEIVKIVNKHYGRTTFIFR